MKIIEEYGEHARALDALFLAYIESTRSECKRYKIGVVIIGEEDKVIGTGYNKPLDKRFCEPKCVMDGDSPHRKIGACSSHAEEMAILGMLNYNFSYEEVKQGINLRKKLENSKMYFRKFGNNGQIYLERPLCNTCSGLILNAGIPEIILSHKEGIVIYGAKEFHKLSNDDFLNNFNLKSISDISK
ncbi:MAG: deaminase [Nanoarchaeota archaeon]